MSTIGAMAAGAAILAVAAVVVAIIVVAVRERRAESRHERAVANSRTARAVFNDEIKMADLRKNVYLELAVSDLLEKRFSFVDQAVRVIARDVVERSVKPEALK